MMPNSKGRGSSVGVFLPKPRKFRNLPTYLPCLPPHDDMQPKLDTIQYSNLLPEREKAINECLRVMTESLHGYTSLTGGKLTSTQGFNKTMNQLMSSTPLPSR